VESIHAWVSLVKVLCDVGIASQLSILLSTLYIFNRSEAEYSVAAAGSVEEHATLAGIWQMRRRQRLLEWILA
jgi:hypothetical protein